MNEEKFVMPEEIIRKAKVLPVILMLDVSGSMFGEPIRTLNESVRQMIDTFKSSETVNAEIKVCVVTFGGEVKKNPLMSVGEIEWKDLSANGCTPLGGAIKAVREIIEDKEQIPSMGYRPTIILVSDGVPTDDWQSEFGQFLESRRASKCQRLALGIGISEGDPQYQLLNRFISEGEKVFLGDVSEITKFFKYATMSVTTRTRSVNPNMVPKISPYD